MLSIGKRAAGVAATMAVVAAAGPVAGAGASIIPSPARPPAVSTSTTPPKLNPTWAASVVVPWQPGIDAGNGALQAGADAALGGWQAGATAALAGWQAGRDALGGGVQLGLQSPDAWAPGAGAQGGLQIGAPR
jgi:hypothetical protein